MSNDTTLPPKVAAPWLHSLLDTLTKLENAAGSEGALMAIEEAISQLHQLENSIAKLPAEERALTLPHLPALMARLQNTIATVQNEANEAGDKLSQMRTRASAMQKYGSVK